MIYKYGTAFTNLGFQSGILYASIIQHFVLKRKLSGAGFYISTAFIIIGILLFSLKEPINQSKNIVHKENINIELISNN